jgi:hypothetical protein
LYFGTVNLVLVLLSLLYMFHKKPEFLIAERGDLVSLGILEAIVRQNNPKLAMQLIKCLVTRHTILDPKERPGPAESKPTESERRKVEEEEAKL